MDNMEIKKLRIIIKKIMELYNINNMSEKIVNDYLTMEIIIY